jgi:predicted nucleic acid-binding protein
VTIYPDTSFFVALRFANDTHHSAATRYVEKKEDDVILWSPWHRIEVANTFRQLSLGTSPVIVEADGRRIINRLERDVRLGYFLHMEADWRDVLRAAYELSAEHASRLTARAADLLHVAYAKELGADLFVTFDSDQLAFAEAAGLDVQFPA